jgi:CO/xanthine dehydrogenase Mo-binding subunit
MQTTIGTSPPRKEGVPKILGTARYVDDIVLEGMIYGATVRSSIARGRIVSIQFEDADPSGLPIDWSQFTVVTAADIPGENTIIHLTKDHPCLAVDCVNHPEEPILLLGHPDKAVLSSAVASVTILYEELAGIFSIEASEEAAARAAQGEDIGVIWNGHGHGGGPNTFKTYLMRKDQQDTPQSVWDDAGFIVEGEYRTASSRSASQRAVAQWK